MFWGLYKSGLLSRFLIGTNGFDGGIMRGSRCCFSMSYWAMAWEIPENKLEGRFLIVGGDGLALDGVLIA